MKVSFDDIAQGKIPEVSVDRNIFKDQGFTIKGIPEISLTGRILDNLSAHISGKLKVSFETVCSRCNEQMDFTVAADFSYFVTVGVDSALLEREKEIVDDDIHTLFVDVPEVDVTELVEEQCILSLPEKVVCSDDCKGLCPVCGAYLNVASCDCHIAVEESPFAVLKKLRKQ